MLEVDTHPALTLILRLIPVADLRGSQRINVKALRHFQSQVKSPRLGNGNVPLAVVHQTFIFHIKTSCFNTSQFTLHRKDTARHHGLALPKSKGLCHLFRLETWTRQNKTFIVPEKVIRIHTGGLPGHTPLNRAVRCQCQEAVLCLGLLNRDGAKFNVVRHRRIGRLCHHVQTVLTCHGLKQSHIHLVCHRIETPCAHGLACHTRDSMTRHHVKRQGIDLALGDLQSHTMVHAHQSRCDHGHGRVLGIEPHGL